MAPGVTAGALRAAIGLADGQKGEPGLKAGTAGAAAGRNRVAGKVAMVIGAGSVGGGWGNGKAAAVTYAREGARVFAVDYRAEAAQDRFQALQDEVVILGDQNPHASPSKAPPQGPPQGPPRGPPARGYLYHSI